MVKPRKAKLRVYCTPAGFHDAFVAAPSQKAALEAWRAKTNLFAQSAAHLVSDERLTKAPLQHPGEVIKVLRGSDPEQLAALERTSRPRSPGSQARHQRPEAYGPPDDMTQPLPKERVRPKPSRARLTKAGEALEALEERQSKQLREIEQQQRQFERKQRELEQRQAEELDAAKERVASEKDDYDRSVRSWVDGE